VTVVAPIEGILPVSRDELEKVQEIVAESVAAEGLTAVVLSAGEAAA
jgi:hypothetical protein